jgi:ligand-binding SRPBCC domain-containing protein
MTVYTLESETLAPVSVREAFELFEDPGNLPKITPPWLDLRITSPRLEMRQGAEITYRIRWAGFPLTWKTVISEYEPPFFFIDEQTSGPYRYWKHRHTFRPSEGGTLVGDRVEYALPLGPIGRLVHRAIVRRQLEQIFAYRHRALFELMLQAARA